MSALTTPCPQPTLPTPGDAMRRITRRHALSIMAIGGSVAVLAACSQPVPTSSSTPSAAAPTTAGAPAPAAAPTTPPPAAQSGGSPADVPRNQTLVLSLSDSVNQFTDVGVMNPFVIGAFRNGWQFAFEPLYFYDMWHTDQVCGPSGLPCSDGEIAYQAESYSYNADATELTVKLR